MLEMCPACRANPELVPVCTICQGKTEVHIARHGDQIAIYPAGSVIASFTGQSPWADIQSGGRLGMPVGPHVSLAQGWEAFRRTCLPDDAGLIQISESRRVFYGAIGWILTALGSEGNNPEEDEAYMASLDRELVEFAADVARGRA